MFCTKCGKEISDDTKFCPQCGTPVASDPLNTVPAAEKKPAKVWTVFSVIGKILGIVCFATAFIPILNINSIELGIIGIVMSCLGRKALTEEADNNCRIGLKFSIAAVAVSVAILALFFVIIYAAALGSIISGSQYAY